MVECWDFKDWIMENEIWFMEIWNDEKWIIENELLINGKMKNWQMTYWEMKSWKMKNVKMKNEKWKGQNAECGSPATCVRDIHGRGIGSTAPDRQTREDLTEFRRRMRRDNRWTIKKLYAIPRQKGTGGGQVWRRVTPPGTHIVVLGVTIPGAGEIRAPVATVWGR